MEGGLDKATTIWVSTKENVAMKKSTVFIFAACLGLGGLWADMMRNPPCKLDEGQNSASTCDKCGVG